MDCEVQVVIGVFDSQASIQNAANGLYRVPRCHGADQRATAGGQGGGSGRASRIAYRRRKLPQDIIFKSAKVARAGRVIRGRNRRRRVSCERAADRVLPQRFEAISALSGGARGRSR